MAQLKSAKPILYSLFSFLLVNFVHSANFIEVGLGLGTNTPIGNLEHYFSAGTIVSAYLGKQLGRSEFLLIYENSSLLGNGLPNYQLQLNRLLFECEFPIYSRSNWSLPVLWGIGNVWLKRKLLAAGEMIEKGTAYQGVIGVGVQEKVSHTKIAAQFFIAGLYNFAKTTHSAYLIGLKITVGYGL